MFEHSIEATSFVRTVKCTEDLLWQPEYVVLFLHISIDRDVRQGSYIAKVSVPNYDGLQVDL